MSGVGLSPVISRCVRDVLTFMIGASPICVSLIGEAIVSFDDTMRHMEPLQKGRYLATDEFFVTRRSDLYKASLAPTQDVLAIKQPDLLPPWPNLTWKSY